VDYRPGGFFTGRQLFVLDPSGNRIELRDASWKAGMPTPTYDEIVKSAVAAGTESDLEREGQAAPRLLS
jgi:hypothetical protein